MDFRELELEGILFRRTGHTGFIIGPQGVTGLDGVDVRTEQTVIPGARGSFAEPGYLASRAIAIKGTCIADTPGQLRDLGRKFTGALADGELHRLIVRYTDNWRIQVQQAAKPLFQPFGLDAIAARFQLNVWAPDPLLYSSTLREFGPVPNLTPMTVFNRGNAASPPSFTVTRQSGTIAEYALYYNDGEAEYHVSRALEAGHPHTIQMDTGDLIIDGLPVLGGRLKATTWDVRPGAPQTVYVNTPNGTATLSGNVRDAIA